MSKNTEIKWYDHTWSPWTGNPRVLSKNWQEPLGWNRRPFVCDRCGLALAQPQGHIGRGRKKCGMIDGDGDLDVTFHRPKVFPSLCDWLDDEVPIEWLAEFIGLISATPNLDWLLLTKRPERWRERMTKVAAYNAAEPWSESDSAIRETASRWVEHGKAPNNVWFGVEQSTQCRNLERDALKARIAQLEEAVGLAMKMRRDWLEMSNEGYAAAYEAFVEYNDGEWDKIAKAMEQ